MLVLGQHQFIIDIFEVQEHLLKLLVVVKRPPMALEGLKVHPAHHCELLLSEDQFFPPDRVVVHYKKLLLLSLTVLLAELPQRLHDSFHLAARLSAFRLL